MMLRANRVNSTTTMVYNYLVRQGSITKTQGDKGKIRKNIEDRMIIIERYNTYIKQYPECQWLHEMRSGIVVSVVASVAQHQYLMRKEYIERLRSAKVFPLTMAAKQGETYLRKARIINISPRLAVELLHLKNKS